MYCRDCGEKLALRFLENEGLVPYCAKCGQYKFPLFPVAVSMTVVNRAEDNHEAHDVLMLNFVVTAEDGAIKVNEELDEARWCSPEEAKALIRKNSTAEYFLNAALGELGQKK